jgi:Penicillin tolerance protein
MIINVAKSAGFCFGVKRAIKIALETARDHDCIEVLGDIVHNEHVAKDINAAGIKKSPGWSGEKQNPADPGPRGCVKNH